MLLNLAAIIALFLDAEDTRGDYESIGSSTSPSAARAQEEEAPVSAPATYSTI